MDLCALSVFHYYYLLFPHSLKLTYDFTDRHNLLDKNEKGLKIRITNREVRNRLPTTDMSSATELGSNSFARVFLDKEGTRDFCIN